jgi:hypothetical protein
MCRRLRFPLTPPADFENSQANVYRLQVMDPLLAHSFQPVHIIQKELEAPDALRTTPCRLTFTVGR